MSPNQSPKLYAKSTGFAGRRVYQGRETVERIEITTQPADLDPPGARGSVEFVGDEPIPALKLLAWTVAAVIVVSMSAGWLYQTFFN